MAPRKTKERIEWVGGIASMRSVITGEGEPFRPAILIWMGPDGLILGTHIASAEEILDSASSSLRATMKQPMYGKPHRPSRIRVASPDLAEAARAGHRNIEFVVAPTPEIDAAVAAMEANLAQRAERSLSYLEVGAAPGGEPNPEGVAAFFAAATELYRAQPWTVVPADDGRIAVTIAAHGLVDGVILVVGQAGESFGIAVFDDYESVLLYEEAAEAAARGDEPEVPDHAMLTYDLGADLHDGLFEEVKAHGWKVAGPAAYPWVAWVEGGAARPPSAEELSRIEAICRALAELVRAEPELHRAWSGGPRIERTVQAETHLGPIDVTLSAPHPEDEMESATDILDEQIDETFELFDRVVLHHFEKSKERRSRRGSDFCGVVADLSRNSFAHPLATLSSVQMEELVFVLVPRHLSVDPTEAPSIVDDLRAFARFLRREYGYENEAFDILDERAADHLESALSDFSLFGPAKTLVMKARAAGYAMDSVEEVEALMRAGPELPPPGPQQLSFAEPPALGSRQKPKTKSRKATQKGSSKRRKRK